MNPKLIANKALEESKLKILSVNSQGLNDFHKGNGVFKNKNKIFLQDTHFNEKDEMLIQRQWWSKGFFNSWTNSRGVAILFLKIECKVHSLDKDDSDKYLILDTTIENINLLLVNIYGPKIQRHMINYQF